ncbi:MAG: ATPase domain-containing protein [Armatimonadota bacterium]
MDRVRTGIEGLDQLLYGGFLRGDAIIVAGAPGTGKTSLAMQYVHNGITKYRENGLFITFEEFPERIYRDASNFGWDFRELEEQGKLKVLFTSPEVLQQDVIRDQGIVHEMIAETGATRVVVDSISNLEGSAENPRKLRESVYGLVNALKAESLTAILTRELHEEEEIGMGPEEFVADGLIVLTRDYVMGHRLRYLEVLKSRGSPHVQTPSLYFIGEGGIRVIPPFQEPFYRFEEAASTGIAQLDDLLGGGIPYGSFYLIETDVDIHQDIFDAGFAQEALETGDRYVRVAAQSDERSRWRALLKTAGLEGKLTQALESGAAIFLGCLPEETGGQPAGCETLASELAKLCQKAGSKGTRFQINVSRLFAFMSAAEANGIFTSLTSRCRGGRSVVLGTVSPRSFPTEQLEKVRAAADGIVRVWSEGNYTFIQVVKTVNSARTPVYVMRPVPQPPFVEIMEQ